MDDMKKTDYRVEKDSIGVWIFRKRYIVVQTEDVKKDVLFK